MTYSIIAFDPETGEIGVAVQTCWPAVGASVPWVEPGVGAVATQSFTNVNVGPEGLARLREGVPAPAVLHEIVAGDPGRDMRQIGIVDATGRAAAHTGRRCVAEAGHVCVPGVSVQGNMVERPKVWLTMLDAFHEAAGDLAERLMAALHAAEQSGGDVRGSQSAALLVAPDSAAAQPWARRYDLRIDRSPQPVEELTQLLRIARGYEALDAALDAAESGQPEVALAAAATAYRHAPDDAQVAFWYAIALSSNGRADEARPVMRQALESQPRLAEFGHRFAEAGHGARLASALRDVPRPDPYGGVPPARDAD